MAEFGTAERLAREPVNLGIISPAERGEIFKCGELEQRKRELEQPWLKGWSARFGACPDRVRAHYAAGCPLVDRNAAAIVGDPEIVAKAHAALGRVPDVAAACVVTECLVICGGVTTRGWNALLPDLRGQWQCISITVPDEAIFAHEVSHAVQRRRPAETITRAQLEERFDYLAMLAVQCGKVPELTDVQMEYEAAADALARSWGFAINTTSGACGVRRRQQLVADIEHRARRATGGRP